MGKQKKLKTNAVRILENMGISYELIEYATDDGLLDGVSVAEKTNTDAAVVYKTLVTTAGPKELFVFIIPVSEELSLKKAAEAAGVKKLNMLPLKDLTKETGYMKGGCTAVGMKKQYPAFIDKSAEALPEMIVSAGKVGYQMKLAPENLARAADAVFADLVQ